MEAFIDTVAAPTDITLSQVIEVAFPMGIETAFQTRERTNTART